MGKGRFKEIPLFSGLKVSGQEVVVGEKIDGRVILDEALDVCREFSLAFDDEFTVEMASNSGEAHNRSRFVYKMAGYNDVWRKTEEVNPNITYMSLRAGSYYLCVRMLNDDGTFGRTEPDCHYHPSAIMAYALDGSALYVIDSRCRLDMA